MAKVDKFHIHGLKRRMTYDEIIGIIDDSNEKITGKLPDRSASFFRNSQEGSYFDGSDAMEQLKEEQGRLLLRQMSEVLLRQNVRTAGRTFHTARTQQLPLQSPVIAQPTQPMDVDAELENQPTPTAPSSSTQQANDLHILIEQRRERDIKRREETTMNHRGEVVRQNPPTITEQIHHINPPRVFTPALPEVHNIATDDETDQRSINVPQAPSQPKPRIAQFRIKTPKTRARVSGSIASLDSLNIPILDNMDTSDKHKRGVPETVSSGSEAKTKKQNKKKTDLALGNHPSSSRPSTSEAHISIEPMETPLPKPKPPQQKPKEQPSSSASSKHKPTEEPPKKEPPSIKKTIHKVIAPSKIGIQVLREQYEDAKNKNIITPTDYWKFKDEFDEWKKSKGEEKKAKLASMKQLYKELLYPKLKQRG